MEVNDILLPLWEDFAYKPHQVDGVKWLLERERLAEFKGGLLCDEMGLGKTIQMLSVMKNNKKPTTLLLCPKAVISQWAVAAIKSKFNVVLLEKDIWKRPSPFFPGKPFLYITNYEKTTKRSLFVNLKVDRLVLDEAHKLANRNGTLYQNINKTVREITWCVTATPVINQLKDIRNLFGLVGYDVAALNNYGLLLETVTKACLHRSMAEMRHVIPELPAEAVIHKNILDFVTEDEGEFYRGIQGFITRRWRAIKDENPKEVLKLIMFLRQLSVHPQIYINSRRKHPFGYERDDWNAPSTKFTVLKNKIEAENVKSKWIVFCQFRDEMELLEAYLSRSRSVSRVLCYHGGLSDKEKEDVIEQTHTKTEEHDVLLLQLQSGGVGLNLQHFNQVVFMSPWWTSALMQQAIGRAVRIGQHNVVHVHMLVLKEEDSMNIDEKMLEKADMKKGLLENIFRYAARGIELHREEEEEEDNDYYEDDSDEEEEEEGEDPTETKTEDEPIEPLVE
jgi:SNF2 family DNA or RNA helicase